MITLGGVGGACTYAHISLPKPSQFIALNTPVVFPFFKVETSSCSLACTRSPRIRVCYNPLFQADIEFLPWSKSGTYFHSLEDRASECDIGNNEFTHGTRATPFLIHAPTEQANLIGSGVKLLLELIAAENVYRSICE